MYRIGVVKEATLQKDHRAYLQCFSGNIGKMKIKDIRQIDIISVNKELRDGGLKYTSVLSYNVALKAVFASALSNGLIENNPVIGALKISKDEPMLSEVKEAFGEQKKMNLKSNIEIDGLKDFIFLTRNGTLYTNANICSIIRRIVARINEQELVRAKEENCDPVEFEYFSPHCCRHTFATRCYEKLK